MGERLVQIQHSAVKYSTAPQDNPTPLKVTISVAAAGPFHLDWYGGDESTMNGWMDGWENQRRPDALIVHFPLTRQLHATTHSLPYLTLLYLNHLRHWAHLTTTTPHVYKESDSNELAEIEAYCEEHQLQLFHCSAKDGKGVTELFTYIVDKIDDSFFQEAAQEPTVGRQRITLSSVSSSKCC